MSVSNEAISDQPQGDGLPSSVYIIVELPPVSEHDLVIANSELKNFMTRGEVALFEMVLKKAKEITDRTT